LPRRKSLKSKARELVRDFKRKVNKLVKEEYKRLKKEDPAWDIDAVREHVWETIWELLGCG